MIFEYLHGIFELCFGIDSHETRTFFILVNSVLNIINLSIIVAVIITILRFRKRVVTKVFSIQSIVELNSIKLDTILTKLQGIEEYIEHRERLKSE